MELLKVEKLNTGYEKKPLSTNVSFTLNSGEIVSIVGPNGCGKSTLLKTVAGLIERVDGEIYIAGIELCKLKPDQMAKLMSVMLTGRGDYEYHTCEEVIRVGRYQFSNVFGHLSKDDEAVVASVMKQTGVDKFATKEFSKLSDGQKQRVLLARALSQEPKILLLDEPTGFLDIGYKIEFMNIIKQLSKEKDIGILMSVHELDLAASVSDRIITINSDNQVDRIGKVSEVMSSQYIKTLFNIKNGSYSLKSGISLEDNITQDEKVNTDRSVTFAKNNNKNRPGFIMIQGTMSSAGKSLITAGLCRIFKQDGFRAVPFKSQNMALNSYITDDGFEMGRAQVMQAEAAGIKPSVFMNPILLKPSSDTGSQVIINGKVYGNMKAKDYFEFKKSLLPHIKEAISKLSETADIIVIEGAGSPAEINLKENDIVNMGMAKLVHSPVLLVGDIDRGGVFAQLLGTINLLDEDEKSLIGGLIVNKFRGDKTILDPGIETLEKMSEKPVVGVIPYMDINLEDEDSLTNRFEKKVNGRINIKVIRLPHISNFTDFDIFESIQGVSLSYIKTAKELSDADMIIIPGSKNTISDMKWLRENGFENEIIKRANNDIPVFGICGGFQMLGTTISDPLGVESYGTMAGLSLLPCKTALSDDKVTSQVSGLINKIGGIFADLSGKEYDGYEIHMGRSTLDGEVMGSNDSKITLVNEGNIYGTYIHGLFDNSEIVKTVIKCLADKQKIEINLEEVTDYSEFKEREYDRLADILRKHLDMEKIYKMTLGMYDDKRRIN